MSTFEDPTRIEQIEATRATEAVVDPIEPAREPLDPEHRAWLIGILGGGVVFCAAVTLWVLLSGANNTRKAEQKTEQVTACTKIKDGTAALTCVVQIDQ